MQCTEEGGSGPHLVMLCGALVRGRREVHVQGGAPQERASQGVHGQAGGAQVVVADRHQAALLARRVHAADLAVRLQTTPPSSVLLLLLLLFRAGVWARNRSLLAWSRLCDTHPSLCHTTRGRHVGPVAGLSAGALSLTHART